MQLSIIIVNWNTRELLARCLETVAQAIGSLQPSATEVIVVDNASTDGSAEMVRMRFPWVRLMTLEENVGFARGNNLAIQDSQGDLVLLLNPDTELRPGALAALTDFLDEEPKAGAVGAKLLNSDGTLQESCYKAPTLLREFWLMFHLDAILPGPAKYPMDRWTDDRPRPVDVLKGACLLIRRSVLDQVGPFDESYFMYSEEVDLCRRIAGAGWLLYWLPAAEVVHHEGESTRQAAGSMFLHLYRSKLLYFRKHRGRLSAAVYKVVLLSATLARLALTPLAWLETGPRRDRHLALAGHYWQLARQIRRI